MRNKLEMFAKLKGVDPHCLLADTLNEGDIPGAAISFDVTEATIRNWMHRYSVERQSKYVVFNPFDRSPEVA